MSSTSSPSAVSKVAAGGVGPRLLPTHLGEVVRLGLWKGAAGVPLSWGTALERGRVCFCFNLGRPLLVMSSFSRLHVLSGMSGKFEVSEDLRAQCLIQMQQPTHFLTLEVEKGWLDQEVPKWGLGAWQRGPHSARLLSWGENEVLRDLTRSPFSSEGRAFWRGLRVMELLAWQFQAQEREEGGQRRASTRRQHRERAAEALRVLRESLDEPLSLDKLARECGVGAGTLSRVVREVTGLTLREHLRALRVARAIELMTQEGYNVTEAAVEVGYSSLSHFTKACLRETGRRPSDYLAS